MLVLLAMILCIWKYVCMCVGHRHFCSATSRESNCESLPDPSKQQFLHNSPQKMNITTRFPFLGVLIKRERKQYLTPYGEPLGELGTLQQNRSTNQIADLIRRCQSWLTCVTIKILKSVWCTTSHIYQESESWQTMQRRSKFSRTVRWSMKT